MPQYCRQCQKEVEVVAGENGDSKVCAICGNVFSYTRLPNGTIINGFMIENEIGRGNMGIVYRAKQINLERYVALKVLSYELANNFDFVDSFFKEARAAASLSHPNIVQAYDAGATPEGIYYFAMELIEGETLDRRIHREGSINQRAAIDIAIEIADALRYAWARQSLCHGDIKPENIILNSSGSAKLADLGLAKNVHDDLSGQDIIATPLYAAPEVIKGDIKKIGVKSDMYAFGGTLYHMLNGTPPFPDGEPHRVMKQHLNDPVVPLIERNPEVHLGLSRLISNLLDKEADMRPASWDQIVEDLTNLSGVTLTGYHYIQDKPKALAKRFDPWTLTALVLSIVTLILLLVTGIYFTKKQKGPSGAEAPPATSSTTTSEADQKWLNLKEELVFLSSNDAMLKVNVFIETYGKDAPIEARTYLKRLEDKINREKLELKHEIVQSEFNDKLDSVIELLSTKDVMKMSLPELYETRQRLSALKEMCEKHEFLKENLSDELTEFIEGSYKVISRLIRKNEQGGKKK